MTVYITCSDYDIVTLHNVQGIRILGPNKVEFQCFGNDWVTWNGVHFFTVERFNFK